ncbi:TPA: hypothetical protein DCW61_01540 [Candidatus Uhrbacteria bacterium]|nr:hypothetical protein [Candidatus Uhrbacteria bacterium]
MAKEQTTRLLVHDSDGIQRKILTIFHKSKPGDNSICLKLPKNVVEATIYESALSEKPKTLLQNVHEMHYTYHESGNIAFSCYDKDGKKIDETIGKLTPNLPLYELSPARCFLKLKPFIFERFPQETRKKRDTDIDLIRDSHLPDALEGRVLELHFWIGDGSEEGIGDKANAIKWFHIGQSLRYADVFPLQHDSKNLQLFVAVVSPKDVTEFPDEINVQVYTKHEASFLHPKIE